MNTNPQMYVQLAAKKLHGISSLIQGNQQSSMSTQSEQQSASGFGYPEPKQQYS